MYTIFAALYHTYMYLNAVCHWLNKLLSDLMQLRAQAVSLYVDLHHAQTLLNLSPFTYGNYLSIPVVFLQLNMHICERQNV